MSTTATLFAFLQSLAHHPCSLWLNQIGSAQERSAALAEKLKERLQPYVDGDRAGFRMQASFLHAPPAHVRQCRFSICILHRVTCVYGRAARPVADTRHRSLIKFASLAADGGGGTAAGEPRLWRAAAARHRLHVRPQGGAVARQCRWRVVCSQVPQRRHPGACAEYYRLMLSSQLSFFCLFHCLLLRGCLRKLAAA